MKQSIFIKFTWRRWICTSSFCACGMAMILVIGNAQINTAYAHTTMAVTFQEGKLTVRVVQIPLKQVMREVNRLSGAQVRWTDPHGGKQEISVEFTDLPFTQALKRLLKGESFLIYLAPTEQKIALSKIWILSRNKAADQPIPRRQSTLQTKVTPRVEQMASFAEQPLELAIETALSDEDLSLRLKAIEDLGHYAQEDENARQTLSNLVHYDSNPQVRDIASAVLEGTQ